MNILTLEKKYIPKKRGCQKNKTPTNRRNQSKRINDEIHPNGTTRNNGTRRHGTNDRKNFRCIFVVREPPYQELGIVTRFDIMAKVLGKGLNPLEVSLTEILEKKMYYIDAEKPVREAAEIMGENQICHLPVKENERVVGIISSSDIFKLYLKK